MDVLKILKKLFAKKPDIEPTEITRRFELISRVGQGSMSKVWRAHDTMTGRIAAVKILDKAKTKRFESRFIGLNKPTEGEIAVQLKHRHIVRTYDHGMTTEQEQFLVMEFVEGVGLSYLVDVQNEMMLKNRLKFIIQMGEAIEYFHRRNWIHRDICPRNILIDTDEHVKLIDFGLVVPNIPDFQKPGNRTGSVAYMAPELLKRQRTDQRLDIFSFAVTCYEILTKELPWEADLGMTIDTILQHINKPPKDIRRFDPDIDEPIADAIMKGLAKHPDDRWLKIGQMLSVFREARLRLEGPDDETEYSDEGIEVDY